MGGLWSKAVELFKLDCCCSIFKCHSSCCDKDDNTVMTVDVDIQNKEQNKTKDFKIGKMEYHSTYRNKDD